MVQQRHNVNCYLTAACWAVRLWVNLPFINCCMVASKWKPKDLLGSEADRISSEQHSSGGIPLRTLTARVHTMSSYLVSTGTC